MNSKHIINACVLAASALVVAQSAQAGEAAVKHMAPTPVVTGVVEGPPVSANAGSSVALYHQLDVLRSQNAILTESLKNTELKNKISSVGKNSPGQLSLTPGGTASFPGSALPGPSAPLSAQVQMVSGSGSNLTAQISLPNGGSVAARVGSNISGLGVVKSISMNEVVVASKSQTTILPFASDSSAVPGGLGMSSMPAGMIPGGVR